MFEDEETLCPHNLKINQGLGRFCFYCFDERIAKLEAENYQMRQAIDNNKREQGTYIGDSETDIMYLKERITNLEQQIKSHADLLTQETQEDSNFDHITAVNKTFMKYVEESHKRIAKLELDFKDLLTHVRGFAAEGVKLEEQNRKLSDKIEHALLEIKHLKTARMNDQIAQWGKAQQNPYTCKEYNDLANIKSTQQPPAPDESQKDKARSAIDKYHEYFGSWTAEELESIKSAGKSPKGSMAEVVKAAGIPDPHALDESQVEKHREILNRFAINKLKEMTTPKKTKTYWVNVYREHNGNIWFSDPCGNEEVAISRRIVNKSFQKTIILELDEAE